MLPTKPTTRRCSTNGSHAAVFPMSERVGLAAVATSVSGLISWAPFGSADRTGCCTRATVCTLS